MKPAERFTEAERALASIFAGYVRMICVNQPLLAATKFAEAKLSAAQFFGSSMTKAQRVRLLALLDYIQAESLGADVFDPPAADKPN